MLSGCFFVRGRGREGTRFLFKKKAVQRKLPGDVGWFIDVYYFRQFSWDGIMLSFKGK